MGLILTSLLRVPLWLYLAAGLFVWGAWGQYKNNETQRERLEAAVETQKLARQAEARKAEAARKVDEAYRRKLKDVVLANAVLSTDADGLRSLLQTAPGVGVDYDAIAVCGIDGERGRALERLLDKSAELLQEGAGRVAELTAKTTALQEYAQSVCVGKNADHKD
jgi:hypothetical protein